MSDKLNLHEEQLEVWDWESALPTGKAAGRSEMHSKGIPHEAVHLWIVQADAAGGHLLFQKRSPDKKSYPGYLDITVGGHVPFGHSGSAIAKEAREEIGIEVDESALIDLGTFRYEETPSRACHREFQRVFMLSDIRPINSYSFTDGEVTAICSIALPDFENLYYRGLSVKGACFDGSTIREITLNTGDFHPELFADSMKVYMAAVLSAARDIFANRIE
jgi:8-oxo-dGTP pyrophosphatase MutT (NUDIX family)